MQLEIRVKENGKWRGMTLEEAGGNLDHRLKKLSECETVIHYTNGTEECFLCTGKWTEHYRAQGKVSISLSDIVLLLDLHPTMIHALKTFGGEILTQERLF